VEKKGRQQMSYMEDSHISFSYCQKGTNRPVTEIPSSDKISGRGLVKSSRPQYEKIDLLQVILKYSFLFQK